MSTRQAAGIRSEVRLRQPGAAAGRMRKQLSRGRQHDTLSLDEK